MNKIKDFIQNKQKSLLYIVAQVIIVFILILVVLLGFSYGYLGPVDPEDVKTTVDVSSSETSELFFTKGTDVSLTIGSENFTESTGFVTSEAVSTATLKKSAEIASVTEKYQVYLNIKDNNYVYTTAAKTPELILTITNPAGEVVTSIDGLNYVTSTDPNTGAVVSGFDITTHKGLIKIAEDYSITTTSEKVDNWKIEVTFVDLATNQEANEGRTFSSDFLLQADKIVFMARSIMNLHQGVNGTNDIYYANETDYRYTGVNPNNYVWFNDELWRIIGVFDDASHEVTNTNLVKLIKAESIGLYAVNATLDYKHDIGYNTWENSTGGAELNRLLNDYYLYNETAPINLAGCEGRHRIASGLTYSYGSTCDFSTSGIKEEYINYIEEVEWKLGAIESEYVNAEAAYNAERSSATSNAPDYSLTTVGKIGLMYPSDYGYAVPDKYGALEVTLVDYGFRPLFDENHDFFASPYEIDWLLYDDQITMTATKANYGSFWYIHSNGSLYNSLVEHLYNVRPSLYLKSDVRIVSGTGTETNPYLLEM